MRNPSRFIIFLTVLLLPLLTWACTPGRGMIPTGDWAGQGTYVDYEARLASDQMTVAQEKAKDARYETTLTITEQEPFGTPALVFEIHSKRGKLMNISGEETNLRFALVKLRTLDTGATLYAVADLPDRPSEDQQGSEDQFRRELTLARASHSRVGNATVLQVYYLLPGKGESMTWTDTFMFAGNKILKTGRVAKAMEKGGKVEKMCKVYWTEELRKIR